MAKRKRVSRLGIDVPLPLAKPASTQEIVDLYQRYAAQVREYELRIHEARPIESFGLPLTTDVRLRDVSRP